MKRIRESTVRVTDVAGVIWRGAGATMTLAMRDLGRRALARQSGTGSPSFSSPRMWTRMASRALASASSRVSSCVKHPGSVGTSTA